MYALFGKPVIDFLIVIIELFGYLLPLRRYMSGNLSKSVFFESGWVTLSANFRQKWASSTNHCWCQQTKAIAFSCCIKISAVHCLVLSQSKRVTDRQTDRITIFDSQDRYIAASRSKKAKNDVSKIYKKYEVCSYSRHFEAIMHSVVYYVGLRTRCLESPCYFQI